MKPTNGGLQWLGLLILIASIQASQASSLVLNDPAGLEELNSGILRKSTLHAVAFPDVWESLGPFPHGSRELGNDPLSAYGGFENLSFSSTDRYPSELADGGFVRWRHVETGPDQTVRLSYPQIRWEFNQRPFGWAALQHASYFRGKFNVHEEGIYLVEFSGVVSFKIDNRAFTGNVYGYTHASHSIVYLSKGEHILYVYAVIDVRISGGTIPPELRFRGSLKKAEINQENHGLIHFENDAVIPEVMGTELISPFASVAIMNANITTPAERPLTRQQSRDMTGWVQVTSVHATLSDGTEVNATLPVHFSIKIAPGQIMAVPLNLSIGAIPPDLAPSMRIELDCIRLDDNERFSLLLGPFTFHRRQWSDVYKITFLDYDFSVHYAMARPPKKACADRQTKCPIVLALHGAGVEASSEFWTNAYRQQENAWVLYPTGRTPWGFDWHGPSFRNIEYALDALHLLPGVPAEKQKSLAINRNKLIYAGHSNGAQGAWWLASHFPDKALAAVPASGYMKIQFYAPYFMRVGDSYADPLLRGILDASIAEHDIDLYAANMGGLPVLARHGALDDNVPPLHSRRLIRLGNEWNRNPISWDLSEIPAQGHWFEGVANDNTMQEFIDKHLNITADPELSPPPLPEAFSLNTLNPASTGSKGGIRILQLEVPFRLGTIRVHRVQNQWHLNTSNIRRFGFVRDPRQEGIESWSVDGTDFNKPPSVSGPSYARLDPDSSWKEENDLLWISQERHPSTYGPISSALNHPFIIVVPSNPAQNEDLYREAAQHIALSWYIYSRGVTQIVRDIDVLDGIAARYNLIVLGGPADNAYTRRRENEGGANMVKFRPAGGFQIDKRKYESPGTGIIFLAPSPIRTRVAVFIAGTDKDGILRAAWSLPFRTGLQIPDYLVVGDEYGDPHTGWTARDGAPFGGAGTKGAGGVLAAGYWNNTWDWDPRCGYLK
ncbi:uncharacterized protein SPPG_06318 [Spizellomyces punctatus DAOM BR117]|uniref:Peptidase S9 prolyl oligopeptidase catalytic domain-containing protein n=1 Tax=Spizellomyces punctatus (strain DAOM BR117) TaxID=645134 RepID=A0A0L0HBS8_SPIPD|nr:hypothetical protein, variant [Spizellomyces punctatus DAOM BR117]XP_016606677.1 uncharacterized protein SPPG_06318 [Spizellomyces punctatus DAOM BR117]KNC98636.1 hypothetical protein, variant [Spizellomyces punctatus DAOM BR117]KNC98637.1 hypothetical protein SPPG_06318 [Spizellomyces punctatus DAOM BR117]|eukprot:XP_016606676.1 hypothetical protein, variant [Spizellomyces punctatus DAOM BR117]